MNRLWTKIALALALLLSGCIAAAYAYIHSDSFTQSLSNSLSTVLGESVELGGQLDVNAVYPQIKLTLPNAKLRTSDTPNGIQRGRLQNLQVVLSPNVLLSGGSEGSVNLNVEDVTIITRSGESESAQRNNVEQNVASSESGISLAEQLMDVRNRVSGLDISLNIAEFSLLARNEKTGNSAFRLSNVEVVGASGNTVRVDANVREGDEITQRFSAQILGNSPATQENQNSVNGTFEADLIAATDQHDSHKLLGGWEIQKNEITLQSLEYKSDDAWLRGGATIDYSSQQIRIESELELRQFEISSSQSNAIDDEQVPPAERLFSYEIFGNGIPAMLSADVTVQLGAVRMNGMPVINGQLFFNVTEGALTVSSEELYLLGGDTELSLELDTSLPQFVGLKLKLEVDDAQLERIRSADGSDTILSRGTADMIMALRGDGPSPGHLVATLDGYVIASVGDAQIKQKYSTLMDVGVVGWAIDKLSLLSKEGDERRKSADLSDPLTIECASLRLYINDGRVEVSNGAIIEFPDNVLFSSGYVDLQSEMLGFAFRTKSRSVFDWSAISIAKYAEIGGSLAAPSITLNAVELAKQGVLSASSMAWGPLPSLVYSLAESGVKNMQTAECSPDIE